MWRRSAATSGTDPVVLDVDASLVEIHTEDKEGTGPTYKGGWGFHPLLVFADATGECLSAMLRPGNAGANTVADHLVVLDEAVAQLPDEIAIGHHDGDDPSLVRREVVIRSDSAGCTEGFLAACRARNIGFSVVARRNAQVEAAIFDAIGLEELWAPAIRQDGELREGAAVIELTEPRRPLALPRRARASSSGVSRSTPAPSRASSPRSSSDTGGTTPTRPATPSSSTRFMRAHAHVEEHISRLKDSGLFRFPFSDLEANRNWLFCRRCGGRSRPVVPAALPRRRPRDRARRRRCGGRFFHAPGRLVRSARREIVRILDGWPTPRRLLVRLPTDRAPHLSAAEPRRIEQPRGFATPTPGQKRTHWRNGGRPDGEFPKSASHANDR